uniref:Uncharacterized protein n=1 Tax=Anguilla anguilla TaxID=7936 RepID=A0A0E9WRV1_ANGAN
MDGSFLSLSFPSACRLDMTPVITIYVNFGKNLTNRCRLHNSNALTLYVSYICDNTVYHIYCTLLIDWRRWMFKYACMHGLVLLSSYQHHLLYNCQGICH